MRTEITEIETKKIIQTINKSKNSFLKKINQNVDPTNQNRGPKFSESEITSETF